MIPDMVATQMPELIPELGHLALIIALAFAICLAIIPLIGVHSPEQSSLKKLMTYARPLTYGMFFFTGISIVILAYSFVVDDFSIKYIASHSNTHLPYYFKISAVWGGHEGSLLLWVFSLTAWTAAVARYSKDIDEEFVSRVLAVMGMIAIGFIAFTLLTSNPFDRLWPNVPMEGRDLNPLLQDVGLIIHPPLLYLGYVGFAVAFAFAVAALMAGKMDAAWARWSRPWTVGAWMFLTMGIALGSWWAYYELGWGGWWFWDPVENASFMPWLVGTALIHSLAVTEKRGTFRNWTILLAIFAFGLSLLGTFLVRSGVITSVHSFAADPSRGIFILMILAIAIGGSLTLYAFRASTVASFSRFAFYSRETALLLCNVILVVAAVTVLLGTLYPLLVDALGYGKISVGPPYFNAVFVPIMSILFIIMGIGPLIRWKKAKQGELRKRLLSPSVFSIAFGLLFPVIYGGEFNALVAMGIALATWVFLVVVKEVVNQYQLAGKLTTSHLGMATAHAGIAITIVGVTIVSMYESETNVKMELNEKVIISGYEIEFKGIKHVEGPNYSAEQGQLNIYKVTGPNESEFVSLLKPERRSYRVQTMGMTEAGIDPGLFRDVYVALGDPLPEGAWAIRVHYKPFVRWIWLGAIFMSVGGIMSMLDKRYRRRKSVVASSPVIADSLTSVVAATPTNTAKVSET
ncbi:cytochrome c-type biogenesis protein CcmF [Colwellia psychrerythraea]|uniref:Cytochrome c-type biogenesis protein CcmF n=1 Tax=Colwellia psychrerythraea TaxID=28229 RepID=A0A099KC33_COLPS|nr:heme lyase CcmF/NrfE family subunit [Colwellia psychrerythraea]KGJ87103.1 cytochrome c-type biogenesis protein CcmF [Colwellia psychrerythraea]